jgi:hypothetical protein
MILPMMFDRVPEYFGEILARVRHWSPEGTNVDLRVDEASDPALFDQLLHGRILSIHQMQPGRHAEAEILLDTPLAITGDIVAEPTTTIIALPLFRYHSWRRLLVTSVNATLSSASLGDTDARKHLRVFGRATIRLARG